MACAMRHENPNDDMEKETSASSYYGRSGIVDKKGNIVAVTSAQTFLGGLLISASSYIGRSAIVDKKEYMVTVMRQSLQHSRMICLLHVLQACLGVDNTETPQATTKTDTMRRRAKCKTFSSKSVRRRSSSMSYWTWVQLVLLPFGARVINPEVFRVHASDF